MASHALDEAGQHEYVVSSVKCTVGDPRNLASELGLEKGETIVVETLNTKQSTFFVGDEAYVTGFPAALNFSNNRFVFEGTDFWDDDSLLSLRIEGGTVLAGSGVPASSAEDGFLWFDFNDSGNRRMAIATLEDCVRKK